MPKKISLISLMILMIAAIDNIRNLPAAALFGSSLIFFFVLSALIFLIPTSLVSAELSAAFPEKSGVCQWVNMAFGKRWAMVAIWLQWINTMVWYPTMLSFIAGTFAYLIDPQLAENKTYLVASILFIFWSMTFINMRGLNVSIRQDNGDNKDGSNWGDRLQQMKSRSVLGKRVLKKITYSKGEFTFST